MNMSNESLLRRSVLCVENEPEDRGLLEVVLADYEVTFARNAFEALRQLNVRSFDAYVVDYWLPDWNGPSLCREIRKIDAHGPVVFYSAAAGDQNRGRALRAGATAYLVKPVEPNELRGKLRALLALADSESLRARVEEEHAISEEISRRIKVIDDSVERARVLNNQALERVARIKAYQAFVERHGTRAHFERWWPQLFDTARANQR
jgi:DNA-binding response OmpR family regulator